VKQPDTVDPAYRADGPAAWTKWLQERTPFWNNWPDGEAIYRFADFDGFGGEW
jgi:hypothetical protein